MKRIRAPLAFVMLFAGCRAKPDKVATFKSPYNSVFYPVEFFNGYGALSNSYSQVYVHYPNGHTEYRQEVLSGAYLNPTIQWNSANDVDFCIKDGRTVEFWNYAILTSDNMPPIEMHHHLNENC